MRNLDWTMLDLHIRTLFYKTFINVGGESYVCKITYQNGNTGFANEKIFIEQDGKPRIEVYLRNVDQLTDNLYYFEQDNGIGATLVIPSLPKDDIEDD
jgi:hypothetical protein